MSKIEEKGAVNLHHSVESAVNGAMGENSPEDILLEELEDLEDFSPEYFEENSPSCCAKLKSKIGLIIVAVIVAVILKKLFGSKDK